MPLSEVTVTKQFEIVCVDGLPAFLFKETRSLVLKDGVEIATNDHRESYPAASDEAKAVLGEALAGALSQVQALTLALAQASEALAHSDQALAAAMAELSSLRQEAVQGPAAAPSTPS